MNNPNIYKSTAGLVKLLETKRKKCVDELPEFEALSQRCTEVKKHTLEHLDFYLEQFEARVTEADGQVHWCATHDEARRAVLQICQKLDAKIVTKGKSMVTEELALNEHLEANGVRPIETDIGEYILQLLDERPVHIVAPALHKTKEEVADVLKEHHGIEGLRGASVEEIVRQFREILRPLYEQAAVGITGANFLVAETGSSIIVTNEGNGDLTQILPKAHVVVTTIDKVIPTLEDAATFLRVLGRSATGQETTSYMTVTTGPKRPGDLDGPDEFHVVLLDAGRSELLGTKNAALLSCIRCSACMNHCPVYRTAGGGAYGWVFPGPIGAALNPHLIGEEEAFHLPRATSVCRRCDEVCPVNIPLTSIMRDWRARAFEKKLTPAYERFALRFWAYFAQRPKLYHLAAKIAVGVLGMLGKKKGRFSWLPFAGGWTRGRDLPAPSGGTFMDEWKRARGE